MSQGLIQIFISGWELHLPQKVMLFIRYIHRISHQSDNLLIFLESHLIHILHTFIRPQRNIQKKCLSRQFRDTNYTLPPMLEISVALDEHSFKNVFCATVPKHI